MSNKGRNWALLASAGAHVFLLGVLVSVADRNPVDHPWWRLGSGVTGAADDATNGVVGSKASNGARPESGAVSVPSCANGSSMQVLESPGEADVELIITDCAPHSVDLRLTRR